MIFTIIKILFFLSISYSNGLKIDFNSTSNSANSVSETPPNYDIVEPDYTLPVLEEQSPDFEYDDSSEDLPKIEKFSNESIYTGKATCKCGTPGSKIVGGGIASLSNYPWTAALIRTYSGRVYCAGTLINNYYVLTASHCVDGMSASSIEVMLGQENFYSTYGGGTKYSVSSIKMHENYNRRTIDYDIAILKLATPVNLTPNGKIVPACTPAEDKDYTGKTATVIGYGATYEGGPMSYHLREVHVPILSNDICNRYTKYNGKITNQMMCAGFLTTGAKDSCQGDSGGPMVLDVGDRKMLAGIVSWGYGCAQAYAPGVYTRVTKFSDWISKNSQGADWCQG